MSDAQTPAELAAKPWRLSPRFVRFVAVSALAAVVNFGARIVLSHWCPYPIAVALAFPVGLVTAFLLNRRFVFRDASDPLHRQVLWFVLVNLAGLAQTLLVSVVLAHWLFILGMGPHAEDVAHAVGIVVPTVTSYFGHKWLSFRSERD